MPFAQIRWTPIPYRRRSMPHRAGVLVASFALVLVVSACGSSPRPETSGSPQPTLTGLPTSEQPYKVHINMEDGSKVAAPNVQVPLTVYGLMVVDKIGEPNKKDEGHIVYYLDVDKIPTTPGESAEVTGEGRSHASANTGYFWKDVAPGPHKLGVQLVNNDDTPFSPPAIDETHVTVVKQTPAPSPTKTG
jgi:hypothetical protein